MVALIPLKTWLQAARLRTLPLSISGVLVGAAVAIKEGLFSMGVLTFALTTTILLQVLSNFANDYGDGVRGTDDDRIGEKRMISSGLISLKGMRMAIGIMIVLSFVSGFYLLRISLGFDPILRFLIFLILGVMAIIAAIKYTVGKNPYGYKAKGDIFVFVFFGLVSCMGTYYLMTEQWNTALIFPACTVGFWSMAVLNLNNMRDRIKDKEHGKITLAVLLGARRAKAYHLALLLLGMLTASSYVFNGFNHWVEAVCLVAFLPIALHIVKVWGIQEPEEYDGQLKIVALSTFFFALLLCFQEMVF